MAKDNDSTESRITFRQLGIHKSFGTAINNVYYVLEDNKSEVIDIFNTLDEGTRDEIKVLISNMATISNFQSTKIRYRLNKYPYGEIKPRPHRFFFFQKCGNNFVFLNTLTRKEIRWLTKYTNG